uniref:Uncharacterized protein n=1 Tax=Anguilla anguilla TaxID=7936 RepID=A0A0E9PZH7_ANGAN
MVKIQHIHSHSVHRFCQHSLKWSENTVQGYNTKPHSYLKYVSRPFIK